MVFTASVCYNIYKGGLNVVRRFAQVVLTREHERLNRVFSYAVPDSLVPKPEVGSRVWVPFGREYLEGYVVDFTEKAEVAEVKKIAQVLGEGPVFSPEQIELARWMADYYMCPLIRAIKAMLPPTPPSRGKPTVSLSPLVEEELLEVMAYWEKMHPPAAQLLHYLADRGETPVSQLSRLGIADWKEILSQLESQGLVLRETRPMTRSNTTKEQMVQIAVSAQEALAVLEKMRHRAPRQAKLLGILVKEGSLPLANLINKAEVRRYTIRALQEKGLIRIEETSGGGANSQVALVDTEPEQDDSPEQELVWQPNPEQALALEKICKALLQSDAGIPASPIVLHGVTGSGKTEVYLQAIQYVLAQGRKAIVLVPEISLTPQTAQRFRRRFGTRVAVMHSRLTPAERQREWKRLKEGKVDIVAGARSALFAPLERLGLIVLDEEHENSYKQDRAPRYHTREVAIKRAELTGAVVLLGSATPTLETYWQVEQGNFQLLKLTERVRSRPLPEIEIVDLRQELKEGNRSIFSQALQAELAERLHRSEQSILFLNRRGFSTFVNCRQCGLVLRCPNCEVSLTYHQVDHRLRCHYCDYQRAIPGRCPGCGSNYLRYFGIGTQRVEEEIRHLFPQARVLRVDVDTAAGRSFYTEFDQTFRRGEVDILVGTQLIAKGFDFPGVTLVGVVTADTGLNLPDFRASERTFQLLTQVAGRAGRGDRPGKVIIQTYTPEHYSILAAEHHDFDVFYRVESQYRSQWRYPPFQALIRLLVSGLVENRVRVTAEMLGRYLDRLIQQGRKQSQSALELLGPSPAPMTRIRGQYRWQMVLRGEEKSILRKIVRQGIAEFRQQNKNGDVNITVDVDPLSML
jgi:primosomal protein N' (replication factor Y)